MASLAELADKPPKGQVPLGGLVLGFGCRLLGTSELKHDDPRAVELQRNCSFSRPFTRH